MDDVNMRGSVLDKAKAIINGARQDQYGNPEDSFASIAKFWNAYIGCKMGLEGFTIIKSKDVALMMTVFKIARELHGAGKEDNMIDAAGYIGLAADMSLYPKENSNG